MSGADLSTITASALLADLSAAVLSKARGAARRGLVHPDPLAASVWWVDSLRPEVETRYRVAMDYDPETGELSWVRCSCLHAQRAGRGLCRCYHVGAVLTLLTAD